MYHGDAGQRCKSCPEQDGGGQCKTLSHYSEWHVIENVQILCFCDFPFNILGPGSNIVTETMYQGLLTV